MHDEQSSRFVRRMAFGEVALLEVDNPPVNVLSPGVPESILAAVESAERDPSVKAIVLRGAGRTFIVGADLTTLQRAAHGELDAAADLHDLLERLENCSKPIVMAIHGNALGGGLELAMAGHYRVATADAKLGQPEVKLGIIPGAEGTQRLPRLIGVARALEMCLTGSPITAPEALATGLIDAVIERDLNNEAVEFAVATAVRSGPRKTRDRTDRLTASSAIFDEARKRVAESRPNEFALLKVIDAIEAAATLPFADGCRTERALFFETVQTDEARTRIEAFFAARAAARREAR
jgi:enoyl-CoA hydratase/carnithine racemase